MSEHARDTAWHVRINGTVCQGNGIGTVWARHGHGMLRVNLPLLR